VGTHIVWDWNGTLFHDIDAVVAASNAAFAEFGLAPLSVERYRDLYCVPIQDFHRKVMGRHPTEEEWVRLNDAFERAYARERARCGLAEGVRELLSGWRTGGGSQSLLSMYGHAELVPLVTGLGIAAEFARVDGRPEPSTGGSKTEYLVRHLDALGVPAGSTVVIGDALDDAVAARAVGARAVLYSGGSHSRASLSTLGVPVVDSLSEAVALARVYA